ncbi:unnamed protein product [Ectocarpus sp. 12 AP-2014]
MHESIYLSGDGVEGPSGWSAERVLAQDPEARRVFFFFLFGLLLVLWRSEMIYRWMFDGPYSCLFGLKDAAELLASKEGWPALYDRSALEKCDVPCAAAVYYDDM